MFMTELELEAANKQKTVAMIEKPNPAHEN
jgi:hypothetical protein